MTDNRTTERLRDLLDEFASAYDFIGGEDEEHQKYLNLVAEYAERIEQAIAATLGSGTLTAEQVEKAIHDCSTYASYDGCTYYASGIRLQAIADELNVELRSWTCEYKPMWNDDDLLTGEYVGMWYTGCGDALVWNADNDECCKPPAFCPYCGGAVKVVSA